MPKAFFRPWRWGIFQRDPGAGLRQSSQAQSQLASYKAHIIRQYEACVSLLEGYLDHQLT